MEALLKLVTQQAKILADLTLAVDKLSIVVRDNQLRLDALEYERGTAGIAAE